MWESLESSLQSLFSLFCESKTMAITLAYGAVLSSNSRLDMIKQAWRTFHLRTKNPVAEKEMDHILPMIKKLSTLRNNAAHGMVAQIVDQGNFKLPDGRPLVSKEIFVGYLEQHMDGEYFLTPAFYNTSKTNEDGDVKLWYNSVTLGEIEQAIFALKYRVDLLNYHVYRGAPEASVLSRPSAPKAIDPRKTKPSNGTRNKTG